jgi:hypothetical protein
MSVQSSIRRRRLLLLLAPLFAFVALASWAIASPVGASPDDDYHLNSIWCGQGERAGLCESASAPETEKVPGALEQSRCYSFLSDQSASCQGAGFSGADNPLVASQRGNFDGNYPPVFYATMSVFASDNISLSVIAMRLFNAFLFVALMTAACFALPRRLRVPLVWGTAICVTPLALFLVPSTNPSSWAILSGSLVWVSLVGYFESSGWRRITLGALSAVGVLIGAGARADSAIYAGLAIVVAIVLTMRFSKIYLLRAILPVALLVLSVAMYFSTNQAGAAMTGLVNGNPIEGTPESIFSRIFLNVPTLWSGILGSGDLGWLDTPLPSVVGFLVLGVFGGLVFRGLRHVDWRKGVALVGTFFSLWALPTYILFVTKAEVGTQVQPRYILPILTILAGVALLSPLSARFSLSLAQRIVLGASLAIAQSVALHYNLRRYVTGNDIVAFNLDDGIEWWWGLPISPMGVWVLGTLAFSGLLVALLTMFDRPLSSGAHPESDGRGLDQRREPMAVPDQAPLDSSTPRSA